jgi:hypothetical protein
MVARLKLKGIDGRAPPGVNHRSTPQRLCSEKKARKGRVKCSFILVCLAAGDMLKLRETPKAETTKPTVERRRWPG